MSLDLVLLLSFFRFLGLTKFSILFDFNNVIPARLVTLYPDSSGVIGEDMTVRVTVRVTVVR